MAAGLTREDLCNNTIGLFGSGSLEGYNVLLKKVIGDDLNIEWKYCPIPIAGRAIGITLDKILMVASADMTDRDLVPQKNIVRSSTLDGVPLVSRGSMIYRDDNGPIAQYAHQLAEELKQL